MTTKKAKTQTKMAIAKAIYEKNKDKKTRAEMVHMFVEKAGLTKAGANSYISRFIANE